MIIEQSDITNPNLYNEYSGGIKQLEWVSEHLATMLLNIDSHIEYILKNASDGNYTAKMGILEDENRVLGDKIYLLEQELKVYKKNEKKEQELNTKQPRPGDKIRETLLEIEENLEL